MAVRGKRGQWWVSSVPSMGSGAHGQPARTQDGHLGLIAARDSRGHKARDAAQSPTSGHTRQRRARHLAADCALHPAAALDLAIAEATYVYDGLSPPRRRHGPALRRHPGGIVIRIAGRCRWVRAHCPA